MINGAPPATTGDRLALSTGPFYLNGSGIDCAQFLRKRLKVSILKRGIVAGRFSGEANNTLFHAGVASSAIMLQHSELMCRFRRSNPSGTGDT